ncbi:hypothetical protein TURU_161585 [Turdus rufiventris]|nr:hypothetical protein TURU_161585 [Turdus rufiventris]
MDFKPFLLRTGLAQYPFTNGCVKAMPSKTQNNPFAHASSHARSACQAPIAKTEVGYQDLKGIQASLQMVNKVD